MKSYEWQCPNGRHTTSSCCVPRAMNCISTHSPRKYAGLPIHSRSFLSCRYLICRCLRRALFGSLVIPREAFLLTWLRPPSVGRAFLLAWFRPPSVGRALLLAWLRPPSVARAYLLAWF